MYSDKLFDSTLKTIEEFNEFNIILYKLTEANEDFFYLLEQSSFQILRELSLDSLIEIQDIYSQRHRIAQKVDKIKSCTTIREYLNTALPLVENGSFPCDALSLIIDHKLNLESHDDGEVILTSKDKEFIRNLMKSVLTNQGFNPRLLDDIIERPGLYHKLERPNAIITSCQTFEQALDLLTD